MESILFARALLALLAPALVVAAIGDWRTRLIPNWLTGGIALAAIPWWLANGYTLWPGVGVQLILATLLFLLFLVFFSLGAMGGGDVKLIAALGLWFPLPAMLNLLLVMSIAGGALTLAMLARHRIQREAGRPEIPYGIAIAFAGLWTIFRTIS